MKKVVIIHENSAWLEPIIQALQKLDVSIEKWFLEDKGGFDLSKNPPQALFFNRMSPSAHTRHHFRAYEHTSSLLSWLGMSNRKIINGYSTWQMENSKILQYSLLKKSNIPVPDTLVAFSKADILFHASSLNYPFLLKHNRGGKGTGVHLFRSYEKLKFFIESDAFTESPDGITLIQKYIEPEEPYVYRLEFIGKKFFYALKMDTRAGFELCPADACSIKEAFCPTQSQAKFTVIREFPHKDLITSYQNFLHAHDIDVAGIECIIDRNGQIYTYDINTNTNYNQAAEQREAGKSAYTQLAEFLYDTKY